MRFKVQLVHVSPCTCTLLYIIMYAKNLKTQIRLPFFPPRVLAPFREGSFEKVCFRTTIRRVEDNDSKGRGTWSHVIKNYANCMRHVCLRFPRKRQPECRTTYIPRFRRMTRSSINNPSPHARISLCKKTFLAGKRKSNRHVRVPARGRKRDRPAGSGSSPNDDVSICPLQKPDANNVERCWGKKCISHWAKDGTQ